MGAKSHAGDRKERLTQFLRAVRDGDDAMVEERILNLSRSRRAFAPLALVVGGFAMLYSGLRLLLSNWRLTLVQVLPAMLIWFSMYDLRAHVLKGNSFNVLRGPILIPLIALLTAITAASFFLNAVFGFAIVAPGQPKVRPAVAQARSHLLVILGSGTIVGLMLGVSTLVVSRAHRPWFAVSLSIVIGVMTVCYVAIPARLIGVKPDAPARDRLAASALGGAVGAVVCTPPYILSRLGILMLGSRLLIIPGLVILTLGVTLQAAATGAVKTVKMSAKLTAGHPPADVAVPDAPREADSVTAVAKDDPDRPG